MVSRIGILGRGRLGSVLGAAAARAGLEVVAVGAGAGRDDLPGVDLVVLALPLSRLDEVDAEALADLVVVDATNYWWETDGALPAFADPLTSTSETVQAALPRSRVVKTFGHASAWELENLGRAAGDPARRALAVAGDADADVSRVAALVDALGFDALPLASLAAGVALEPGGDAFGADATADELRAILERFPRSQRGRVVARARGGTERLPTLLR